MPQAFAGRMSNSGYILRTLHCLGRDGGEGEMQQPVSPLDMKGTGPNLFERDWLQHIKLDWNEICNKVQASPLNDFGGSEEGTEKRGQRRGDRRGDRKALAHWTVSRLLICRPTSATKILQGKACTLCPKRQDRSGTRNWNCEGTLEPVRFSQWAAPIVPVLKPDGTVRIYGDYRVTVNQTLHRDQYPIPRIDDLFSSLAGGRHLISELDLSHAYQQLLLDEETKKVCDNQHPPRPVQVLSFGVSFAQAIFQRVMDSILQGIPHTIVYLDDILITGKHTYSICRT